MSAHSLHPANHPVRIILPIVNIISAQRTLRPCKERLEASETESFHGDVDFLACPKDSVKKGHRSKPIYVFIWWPCVLHFHIKAFECDRSRQRLVFFHVLVLSQCLARLMLITVLIKLQTKAAFKLGLLRFAFNEEIIPLTTQARFMWV